MTTHHNNSDQRAIKTISFDLDDTLWHNPPVIARAEQRLFDWLCQQRQDFAQHYSVESLQAMRVRLAGERPELSARISELRIEGLVAALTALGESDEQAERQARQGFEVFIQARHEVELFSGVEALLSELGQRYQIGALTNGNADVRRLALGRLFHYAFSAEQVGASKPAPALFIAAQQAAEATPGQHLHIGDHPRLDVEAGLAAGCHCIWFNPEGEQWRGDAAPAGQLLLEVSAIDQLAQAIDRIEALLAASP